MANNYNPPLYGPPATLHQQMQGGVREVGPQAIEVQKAWQRLPTQTWPQEIARTLTGLGGLSQAFLGESPLERFGIGPVSAARRQFAPIAQEARRALTQDYAPSLAERFTALGINSPTGEFSQSLAGAAGTLESKLAALQAQNVMQAQAQREKLLPYMLSEGFKPGFENIYAPIPQEGQAQIPQTFGQYLNEKAAPLNQRFSNSSIGQKLQGLTQGQMPQQSLPQATNTAFGQENLTPNLQRIMQADPAIGSVMQDFLQRKSANMPIINSPEFGPVSLRQTTDLMKKADESNDQSLRSALNAVDNVDDLMKLYDYYINQNKSAFNKLPKFLKDIINQKTVRRT